MMIIAQMYPGAICCGAGAGGMVMVVAGGAAGMVIIGAGNWVITTGGAVASAGAATMKLAVADQSPWTGA